jgi:hypothetical protein
MAVKASSRKKVVADTEATKVLDSVQELDLPTVVNEMGALQVQVQQSLSTLGAALTSKVQRLGEVDQAIALKEQRLKELFQIEAAAVSLDDLRQEHEQETEEYEKTRGETLQTWTEEQTDRAKKWKREADDYAYATKTQRDRDLAEYQAEVASNRRAETLRQTEFNRVMAEREATMKAREVEVDELRKTVAGVDARVKAEIARAEAILTNVLKKQHEHELQLLHKDSATSQAIHVSEITSLKATIAGLQEQVKDLNIQLLSARADAKEVAQEALTSASGRQVSDALQGVMSNSNAANKTK